MRSVVQTVLTLLAAGCAATSARQLVEPSRSGGGAPVYAALPFQNLSPDSQAPRRFLHSLLQALEMRGAQLVPAEELERVLHERRIRYLDSVSVEDAQTIGEATGAGFLILGSLLASAHGPSPRVSVALRLIDTRTGQRVQSQVVSLRGQDFVGLLGLGGIEDYDELTQEVLARLLDGFDDACRPYRRSGAADPAPRGRGTLLSTFLHPDFDPAQVTKIAVLPFSNRTESPAAGRLVSELLSHRWFAARGVEVVEPSELRAALRRGKVRSIEGLELGILREAGRDLGTRYFVLGGVDRFREEVAAGSEAYPEVQASLRIVDVESGRVVAATGIHSRGDDHHILLGLGSVRDPVALADCVAHSMIEVVSE